MKCQSFKIQMIVSDEIKGIVSFSREMKENTSQVSNQSKGRLFGRKVDRPKV